MGVPEHLEECELTNGAELGEIKTLVTRQQEYIVDLLLAHKSELKLSYRGSRGSLPATNWRSSTR